MAYKKAIEEQKNNIGKIKGQTFGNYVIKL